MRSKKDNPAQAGAADTAQPCGTRTPLDIPFVALAILMWLFTLIRAGLWNEALIVTPLAGGLALLVSRQTLLGFFHPQGPASRGSRVWGWALYLLTAFFILSAIAVPQRKVVHAGSDYQVPFQLPGPLDNWSEGMTKQITVETTGTRDALVTLFLHESHDTAPPRLAVMAGKCEVEAIQVEKGNGAQYPHWKERGRPSSYQTRAPRGCMSPEDNKVSLRPVEGSWIVINKVEVMELPLPWEPWRQVAPPWNWILLWFCLAVITLRGAIGAPRIGRKLAMFAMMWLVILGAVVATLVAMAAYVETRNRWMVTDESNFRSPQMFYGSKFIHNAEQGWTLLPGFVGRTISSGTADPVIFYKVNNQGYRSLAYEDDFPAKGKVMVLGDSFAQGAFLAQEETIPAVMSARLGGYVYNFGVGGFSTDQEYTTFMKWVDRVDTQWVALLFFANDILFLESNLGHTFEKSRYVIEDGQVDFDRLIPVDPDYVKKENDFVYLKIEMEKTFCCFTKKEVSITGRISRKILQYLSHLHYPGELLSDIIKDIRKTKAKPGPKHMEVTAELQSHPEKHKREFDIAFQFLDRIRAESEKRKRKFFAVYIPDIKQIYDQDKPERAKFRNMFMDLCARNKMDCLDPSEELAEKARWSDTHFIDDGHLSPYGAKIVGDMIADYIRDKEGR
ncbi:MAG: SGNH/GDSL hydrolase family protein [Nitrospinota bacterium]|nr:SGNH/GDSL hydrolase family protein [Nitrospinota bacterium]